MNRPVTLSLQQQFEMNVGHDTLKHTQPQEEINGTTITMSISTCTGGDELDFEEDDAILQCGMISYIIYYVTVLIVCCAYDCAFSRGRK